MPIDYAQFSGKCTRAPPNAASVQAGEAIKLLLSGQASTQRDAAALVHVSESTLSKLKTQTKAPTTKWYRRPTVQVEVGPGASYSKELRFGEQTEQAGEAHARARRNYRRKMAALKELQQRSVAQVVEVDGTGEHTVGRPMCRRRRAQDRGLWAELRARTRAGRRLRARRHIGLPRARGVGARPKQYSYRCSVGRCESE